MSFVTKEWKDRLVEFAGRRKLINVVTGEEMAVDVTREEGNISQVGDSFSAANMNDFEHRVAEGFQDIPFAFGIDPDGNYGYIKAGADTVTPFRGKPLIFDTSPVDMKQYLPDIWNKLTMADFIVGSYTSYARVDAGDKVHGSGTTRPVISYNSESGQLSFSGNRASITADSGYGSFGTVDARDVFAVWRGTVGGQ